MMPAGAGAGAPLSLFRAPAEYDPGKVDELKRLVAAAGDAAAAPRARVLAVRQIHEIAGWGERIREASEAQVRARGSLRPGALPAAWRALAVGRAHDSRRPEHAARRRCSRPESRRARPV
jgi:hypothetical protein